MKKLASLRVTPLVGSNDSFEIIEKAASKSHLVIHTGGTAAIIEDVRGKKGSNIVYNDLDSDQINGVADEKLYRNVDLFVINTAQANPLLKSVIVIPPLIYGIGTGLFNRASFQLPLLIRTALK